MFDMLRRVFATLALMCALGAVSGAVDAQTYRYHVYIDSDLNASTGCTVTGPSGQTLSGVDVRMTAEVSGNPPQVTAVRRADCSGGVFPAGTAQTAGYPVGLNNGVAGSDVIELAVSTAVLPGLRERIRVGFGAESATGSTDFLLTGNGAAGGPPMLLGLPISVPTIGTFGALLMAMLLAGFAVYQMRRNRFAAQALLVGAFVSVAFAAWASNFIADGQVGDWTGSAPLGNDPTGDAQPPLQGTDIVAGFGAFSGSAFFFRIDVVDAENRPPLAVNDAYTTLEDTPLNVAAPGVLGNDSDPDGNPITAQLVTGPTRGTLTLNANGSFSYTPNANANGTDSFTYNAFDGQVPSTTPATVTITITPVNDAPSFTAGPNQTVNEDAGPQTVNPWATALNDGDPEVAQNLSFEITNNTNAALFSTVPAVSSTGVLTYTPAANANGSATITLRIRDDGGTANGGVDVSATQSFTITVTAVNDAPTFTAGANQSINEDAAAQTVAGWATAINDGDPELTQTLTFLVNVTGTTSNLSFVTAPAVDATTGTLTYAVAPNTNGVATVEVRLQDNGPNAPPPNQNTSAPQTFTITVAGINDAPSFTAGPNQTVNEDAGPQTVNPWATALNDGDPEVTQVLSFEITNNTNAALFSAGPAVSSTGALTYTPAANANGSATITLRIRDDGGTANGGVDVSPTQSFTITVNPINDAPSFTVGPNQVIGEDAGPQTVNPWATAISPGPADEAGQTVSFAVTGNSNAALFATAPSVSSTGVLTYTPAANANGVATITLTLSDNGPGAPPPNQNTSAPQNFTITVNAVNDAPVNTVPAAQSTGDGTPLVFSTANANAISLADVDAAAGIVQVSFGTGNPANGTLTLANPGGVLTTLTGNGTELVIASGTLTAINTALNGPSGSLTYTPVVGTTATRTITMISNDQGNTGTGGALTDTDIISVNVDSAPVVSSTPASGATIAQNQAITVNFSEPVNVTAGITFTCTAGSLSGLGGTTGSGVTSLNLTYAGVLGGTCTLTVPAASVTDVDTIDPPNNPAGNFVATLTVDAAPTVTATTPANGATVATNTPITATFSEAVDISSAGDFSLECPSGTPLGFTVTSPPALPASTTSVTIVPLTALPAGASCTFTVRGTIPDSDLIDPPDTIGADVITSFTTDAAPAFVSSDPAANGAVVSTAQAISFTFNENVADLGGAITLNCGGAVTGTISGGGTPTLTFTPSAALTAGASCTATAVAAQIGDSDSFDPPQNPVANVVRTFTVDSAPTFVSSVPATGTIDVGLASNIVITFSEAVNFAPAAFTLECPVGTAIPFTVTGTGTNTATIDPTPATLPINTACRVTVDMAQVTDVDTADPPNAGTGISTINFTTVNDNPPSVTASTPAPGATTANNVALGITFNEPINATAGSVTLTCGGPNLITGGTTGSSVNSLTPTYAAPLPNGANCTLTVLAANITDADLIDPPDQMVANYVANFTVDAPPTLQSSTPAAAAVVSTAQTVSFTYNEPVTDAGGAITLNCGGAIAGTTSGSGTATLTFTPTNPLPAGTACTATAVATLINDADAFDPPQNPLANGVINFTVDAPPAFVSSVPAANGDVVGTGQTISFTFDENVADLGGAITLNCGGAVTGTITGGGTPTLVFTPSAALTAGASCTATAVAAQIGDSDSFDPPQNPVANVVRTFTVDSAPTFVSSVPATGTIDVGLASNIVITFSEAVNFAPAAFTLECPVGTAIPFTVTGTGTNTATIDPTPATLPINTACRVTVDMAQVTDVDTADPPNAGTGISTINFTTVNDNPPAVSTVEVEIGNTFTALPLGPGIGSDSNTQIRVTFSETVNPSGAWAQLLCTISGSRTVLSGLAVTVLDPVFVLTPSVNLTAGESCTLTVFATLITDDDPIDPPDNMVANFVTTFDVDAAPAVTTVTPANGATAVATNSTITVNFSEPVNIAAGGITLNCGAAISFGAGLPATNVSSIVLTPSAPLPETATCNGTVVNTLVTDADPSDPPNQMVANFTWSFTTVDQAPTVSNSAVEVSNVFTNLPLPGGSFADADTDVRVTFSELVNPTGNWASLVCASSGTQSVGGGSLVVSAADPVFTLNPATNLTPGENCTFTVFGAQVADDDTIDPPNLMTADAVFSFTVRDVAPTVTSSTPVAAATVPNTQVVTLNFSEPVNLAAGSVAFNCGAAVSFTPALPQTNVSSLVLTPTAALPNGTACSVTLTSTGVTDVDAVDPPNELDGNNSGDIIDGDADNFVLNFSVDQAPSVTSTTPANGATDVLPTSTITVNFSESVAFDTVANAANTSFDLECPAATPADFTVTTASPASSVVIDPVDNAIAGRTCVLTVRATGITDNDAIDPPNNMLADFSATISFGAIANNDTYTVTPHLTLTIPTSGVQGGGAAANDILGAGTITGFGFAPTCTGTAPGVQLNAGAGNGRLTLNANGSFVYEPPAGIVNVTRTFCYTVTGNDTANIEFTLENQSRVWFVNAAAAASGDGTQARPFNALTGAGSFDAVAADGDNDTIYIEGDQTGGLTLRPGQRVIGGGSTATIATFSGVTAIAGSGFPALSGTPPVITCSNVTCLTLNNSGAANTHSLRGFTIGDSGATGTDIGGTTFGTLTVAELTLTGSGTTMNLTTGTLNGTLLDLNANAGSGSLTLSAVGGTWSVQNQVDLSGVTIGAFSIANMPAGGGVTLTGGLSSSLGNGSISLTGNASPINLGNVLLNTTTSMTVSGSSGLTTVTGGSLTTPVNTLVVANSAVNITLGTLTSSGGAAGPNLSATNFTGSINIAGGAISNSLAGSTAVVLSNSAGTFSYGGSVAKATAGRVIDISGGTGNITFSGNVSCLTSCGTGAGNEGLRVNGRTGGTVTFSGTAKQFSSSATNPAISLTTNTGSTINFTGGGLAITTTSGTGFSATGGGTVTVQGTGNTVSTTTGTAVNVTATSIGGGGMTFESINSTTASANTAIVLNNTGAGGFSVTGTGAAGSGGTISNKTVDAVQLNTTGGLVTLNRMIIEDIGTMTGAIDTRSGHDAIEGLTVNGGLSLTGTTIRRISDQAIHGGTQGSPDTPTVWNGLTLSGVTIENTNRYHVTGSGDANNEGTVRILGLRGTVNVTNSTFSLGAQPLDLEVTAGTLNLTATGNTFDRSYKEFTSGVRASIGNHCIDVRVLAGASANVVVGDRVNAALANNFLNCRLGSIRVVNQPGAGANTDAIIARNNFRVDDHSSGIGGNFDFPMGGTLVWNLGSGTMDTIVENNLFELVTNASGGVGQLSLIAEGGPVQALVQNNTFDRPGNAPWWVQSRGSAASVMTARFVGNTVIRGAFPCTIDPACGGGYFAPGLRALADAQTGATLNFTMENNVMARHDTGFDPGQTVEVRALNTGAGPTVCSRFLNNRSPDGYSLEQLAGTVRTVAAAGSCAVGSPSPTCQTVFQSNGNLGGAGVDTTNPPFVNVFGTVTVNNTACPIPTGAPF